MLPLSNSVGFLVRKSSTDGSGLLVSEVKGEVCERRVRFKPCIAITKVRTLGLLVELPEVLPLLLVDDGENSGDGFADGVAEVSQHIHFVDSHHKRFHHPAFPPTVPPLKSHNQHPGTPVRIFTTSRQTCPPVAISTTFQTSFSQNHKTTNTLLKSKLKPANAHLGQLARTTTRNLLYPQRRQFRLELFKLFEKVGLAPKDTRPSAVSHPLLKVMTRRTWTGARRLGF